MVATEVYVCKLHSSFEWYWFVCSSKVGEAEFAVPGIATALFSASSLMIPGIALAYMHTRSSNARLNESCCNKDLFSLSQTLWREGCLQ